MGLSNENNSRQPITTDPTLPIRPLRGGDGSLIFFRATGITITSSGAIQLDGALASDFAAKVRFNGQRGRASSSDFTIETRVVVGPFAPRRALTRLEEQTLLQALRPTVISPPAGINQEALKRFINRLSEAVAGATE